MYGNPILVYYHFNMSLRVYKKDFRAVRLKDEKDIERGTNPKFQYC